MFPTIRTLADVLPFIKGRSEFFVKNDKIFGKTFTSICYMYADEKTFESPVARECRGLVFDEQGTLVVRPFHKFFNLNERSDTQAGDLSWEKIVAVEKKMDGSMISFVPVGEKFKARTKAAFFSAQAVTIDDLLATPAGKPYLDLLTFCRKKGLTPLFEYTSPSNQVVVHYDQNSLTFLAAREIESGIYLPRKDSLYLCEKFGVPCVSDVKLNASPDTMKSFSKNVGEEGVVLVFENGERIKVKTDWYVTLHRSVGSLLTTNGVLEAWASETFDDMLGLLRSNGLESNAVFAMKVVHEATTRLNAAVDQADHAVRAWKNLPTENAENAYKALALATRELPVFPLIMAFARNPEGRQSAISRFRDRTIIPEIKDLYRVEKTDSKKTQTNEEDFSR